MGKIVPGTKLTLPDPPILTMTLQPINHQITTFKLLRAIGESLEPEGVAYLAVEKVIDLTGWASVAILTPGNQGALIVRAAMGSLLTDFGMNGRAYRTGDTQVVNDLIGESDEGPTYQKSFSALSVPIIRSRRRLGVFNVEKDEPFSQDEIFLAESMAEVIALALDNAELYAESQRRLAAQTAMQEAVSAITSSLDIPVVLNRIVEQMGQALRATSAYICSYERDTKTSTVLAEYYSLKATVAELESDLGVTYYLPETFPDDIAFLEKGEMSIIYSDDLDLNELDRAHYQKHGAKTVVLIPIKLGEDTIAFAELWDTHEKRTFSDDQIALCSGIAQHAAIAIGNARLFQAIQQEHGRFQALIDSDDDGILLIGIGGKILVVNAPAHELLRLSHDPDYWRGKMISEVVGNVNTHSPNAAAIIQTEMNRVKIGNEPQIEGEFEVSPKILHWRNLPVITDGVPLGRLIVIRDITKERALKKMQEDLTHTMVHDLRGPLTAISISLDVLQMLEKSPDVSEEKRQKAISRAATSTQNLLELVESILEISRLESGRLEINDEIVDFTEIVESVMDQLLPVALEKGITLASDLPPRLPKVKCDKRLIHRVVQNLIDNAVKFTPAQGKVCVKVHPHLEDHEFLLISVHDSGLGIPWEVQENLFEKFAKGTQSERGSGLGLYFCKMVTEAHNGRIWLERSDAKGTIIQMKLPLKCC